MRPKLFCGFCFGESKSIKLPCFCCKRVLWACFCPHQLYRGYHGSWCCFSDMIQGSKIILYFEQAVDLSHNHKTWSTSRLTIVLWCSELAIHPPLSADLDYSGAISVEIRARFFTMAADVEPACINQEFFEDRSVESAMPMLSFNPPFHI